MSMVSPFSTEHGMLAVIQRQTDTVITILHSPIGGK